MAFRLFHGQNGVVPLAGRAFLFDESQITETSETGPQFDPLAAKAATISLSVFGPGGPFGFDPFSKNKQNKKASNFKPVSQVCNCLVILYLMLDPFPTKLVCKSAVTFRMRTFTYWCN